MKKAILDTQCTLSTSTDMQAAQRSRLLAALSTKLQGTLDALRESLSDLKSASSSLGTGIDGLGATLSPIVPTSSPSLVATAAASPAALPSLKGILDLSLSRQEGRMAVSLSEFRTKVEANKLRAIYAFSMGVAAVFLGIVVVRQSALSKRLHTQHEQQPY